MSKRFARSSLTFTEPLTMEYASLDQTETLWLGFQMLTMRDAKQLDAQQLEASSCTTEE